MSLGLISAKYVPKLIIEKYKSNSTLKNAYKNKRKEKTSLQIQLNGFQWIRKRFALKKSYNKISVPIRMRSAKMGIILANWAYPNLW